MIYVPTEFDNKCVDFDNGILFVYDTEPDTTGNFNYTYYYLDYHYLEKSGLTDTLPVDCIDSNFLTNNIHYRNDITDVYILYSIFLLVPLLFIIFIVRCFFRGKLV